MPKMAHRIKDIVTLILFASGLAILTVTYLKQDEQPTPLLQPEQPEIGFLDVDSLLSEKSFSYNKSVGSLSDADILAVFVLNADVCAPCINEIVEYTELLRNMQNLTMRVEPIAIVLENDSTKATRFIKIVDLPMPVGYGYPITFIEPLTRYNDLTFTKQLIFVKPVSGTVFFRIGLSGNSHVSLRVKEEVLSQMRIRSDVHRSSSPTQPTTTKQPVGG